MATLIQKEFPSRLLLALKISDIDCVGLAGDSEESLAVWLVYQWLSAPLDSLLNPLEAAAGWTLEFPKLLILGDSLTAGFGPGIVHGGTRALPDCVRSHASSRPHPGPGFWCKNGHASSGENGGLMI